MEAPMSSTPEPSPRGTEERLRALADTARPTPKGHRLDLRLYVYDNGWVTIQAEGVTQGVPNRDRETLHRRLDALLDLVEARR
jgi:hypothetical protein